MRDGLLAAFIFGLLPFILWRPPLGILAWSWLGYMNPHRLTWGFAYDFPFSQLVAACTIAGLVFYKDRRSIPLTRITIVLALFVLWFTLSTLFSLNQDLAWREWDRSIKILLFAFLTIVLMQREDLVKTLIWVIALSFAFFGAKGGFFSIITAGNFRVLGPPGSFIEDNNSLALALIMAVPLMRFCQTEVQSRFARHAWTLAIGLTGLSILTSHSRGALVGVVLTLGYAWWKSRNKLIGVLLLIPLLPLVLSFLPEHWFERMGTIATYDEDASAMGRINAWWFAFNLALDRPFVGGGFQVFTRDLFQLYAPNPDAVHDSHSIYFEVLGEHGFVGLTLFLLIGAFVIRETTKLIRMELAQQHAWIPRLAALLRLSFVGYAITGAFLGLAYFDLYYQLVAVVVVLKVLASKARENSAEEEFELGGGKLAETAGVRDQP